MMDSASAMLLLAARGHVRLIRGFVCSGVGSRRHGGRALPESEQVKICEFRFWWSISWGRFKLGRS